MKVSSTLFQGYPDDIANILLNFGIRKEWDLNVDQTTVKSTNEVNIKYFSFADSTYKEELKYTFYNMSEKKAIILEEVNKSKPMNRLYSFEMVKIIGKPTSIRLNYYTEVDTEIEKNRGEAQAIEYLSRLRQIAFMRDSV